MKLILIENGTLRTDGTLIPTVQALYDFISTFHNFEEYAKNNIEEIEDDGDINNHYEETILGSANIEEPKDLLYPPEELNATNLTGSGFRFLSRNDDSDEYIIIAP